MPMKLLLLTLLVSAAFSQSSAQSAQVDQLPLGKYESRFRPNQQKWQEGDIILSNAGKYSLTGGEEGGEYRFSKAAQRVFFTSGRLKGMFATTTMVNNRAVIVFPITEVQPVPIAGEIWASHKQ
jgi:hypothetical protein